MEQIILVDSQDNELGASEKMAAHKGKPQLHRAFSVFIFNREGRMLLQKRSGLKKTWPGFWTNACCSHPRPGEEGVAGAQRRLREELGFSTDLEFLFKFEYAAMYDSEWGEHELDWCFAGFYDGEPKPDPNEIEEYRWVGMEEIAKDIEANQQNYTPWFKLAFPEIAKWHRSK